jgi:hypothetical protein
MTAEAGSILTACCAMLLDILTGFCGALKEGDVSSKKLRNGLWHKAGFAGLIALAVLLVGATQYVDLGIDIPAVEVVCVYVIFTEVVSVIENLCVLNDQIAASPLGKLFRDTAVADADVTVAAVVEEVTNDSTTTQA